MPGTDALEGDRQRFLADGFAVLDGVFSRDETDELLSLIAKADAAKPAFRKNADLFAVRRFFLEVPSAVEKVFTPTFTRLITAWFGNEFFVVKSIYFDKPETSNWFVAYHQDLTIAVDEKVDTEGFGPWTTKGFQYAVQPPLSLLQNNFTVRIHLDDTTAENGALRVIPGSHLKGICRAGAFEDAVKNQTYCNVKRGGVLLMKPLLLHSSGRTRNGQKRRVIHIEFSRNELPQPLRWAERMFVKTSA